MKLKKTLLTLFIVLSYFQIFCQVSIDKPDINWHHMDMTIDKIPGVSTNRAYGELLKNKKATKIIVAIIDDGLDIEHKDLIENIWTNIDEIPNNGIDDDKNGYIDDIHGWNFLGNPNGENLLYDTWEQTRTYISLRDQFANIELMAIRVCPYGDERDKDVANAIYYAVDNGAKILNMSFGKTHSPNEAHVNKAIRYAEKKGVLLITGSGNDGTDVDKNPRYPNRYYSDGSECSTWINVGSTTRKADTALAANFSCYGKKNVDIMAPGSEILSLLPGNETFLAEGTSISAPIVSGVAALVWSNFPELTAIELKSILLESVEYFGDYEVLLPGASGKKVLFKELSKTGGIVNAYNAILLAKIK